MRPIDKARVLWEKRYNSSFTDVIAYHMACNGCLVVSDDKCFVLGRPVDFNDPNRWLKENDNGDALCITIAVGNLSTMADIKTPFNKLCFYRRNDQTLRIFETEKFLQKCKQLTSKKQ